MRIEFNAKLKTWRLRWFFTSRMHSCSWKRINQEKKWWTLLESSSRHTLMLTPMFFSPDDSHFKNKHNIKHDTVLRWKVPMTSNWIEAWPLFPLFPCDRVTIRKLQNLHREIYDMTSWSYKLRYELSFLEISFLAIEI